MVNSASETISEVKGFEDVSIPINNGISKNDDMDSVPCNPKEVLDQPLSGKGDNTPTEVEERLTKGKNDNDIEHENPFETNKSESMHRLDHLA